MSRYLTPSKIGLLALISLYTESVVPSVATIPILSFIVSHVLPTNTINQESITTVDGLQKATITHASGIPGRTIWDLLLKKLWEVNSFDALHAFFDALSSILVQTQEELQDDAEDGIPPASTRILLSRTSPLGAFVRRAKVEFTRLPFYDGVTLWKYFVVYREPTLPMWRKRNPQAGKQNLDTNFQDLELRSDHPLARIIYRDVGDGRSSESDASPDEVEKLLEQQVAQMQKTGNRLPESMKWQLMKILQSGVKTSSLPYYVKFLDSWKAGDYPSSFDNLHRYFDYTMHNRDRTFYQYALFNLAILQADFGCFDEAIVAMHETISTARENNDIDCLNYSLSWLYHFGKAHPQAMGEVRKSGVLGSDKEALGFLKAKAKETNMWGLLSTSFLSEAKLALSVGDSSASAFESIMKASHLNITKGITNAMGSQMMLQSALFGRLGVAHQAWSYNELFLRCYAEESPVEDIIRCKCRSAYALALKGRHEEATAQMDDIDPESLRSLRTQQTHMAYLGILKLRRHLHRDNLVAAEHIISQIRAIPSLSLELSFIVSQIEIEYHMRYQDYSTALNILEKLADKLSNEEADVFERITLMILKARILDKAGTPQKGFSVTMRAASLAYRARLVIALWEAIGALARVLISLREYDAAVKLLVRIMPHIFECEDCELAAHSFSSLADAHMGMAGEGKDEKQQRQEHITKALEYVNQSFDEFSRIEDVRGQCEMMAKKATIMHLNGDLMLANDCAAMYLDIKRAAREENQRDTR